MLDRQKVFDTALKGIIQQGCLSLATEGNCAYRGKNNTRCAVGWLIPDNRYDPKIEGGSVVDRMTEIEEMLAPKFGSIGPGDFDFLLDIQSKMHDSLMDIFSSSSFHMSDLKANTERLAKEYSLTVDVNLFNTENSNEEG